MVRAFIGIFLPENLRNKVVEIQKIVKTFPLKAKFVERENLHLTLSFLGEIDESEIKRISKELDKICKEHEKFEVRIKNLIPIPSKNFIRVIAFKIESENLEEISKDIKKRIGGDIKPPHLTICRIKNVLKKEIVLKRMNEIEFDEKFLVNSIELIKSKLTQKGPIYSVIHESKLK